MAGFTTRVLHADRLGGVEHGSIHKPIHASVAYGYEDAHDLAAVFQGKTKGYTYGRQVNPTVSALEQKITLMEEGLETVCFATGMAAIGTLLFALLKAGDHFISSSFLFGNTNSLFNSFQRHGIQVSFVDATDVKHVEEQIQDNTKLVFVETIANPRTQVADLHEIGNLCEAKNLIYVVDNTLTTPYLYLPICDKAHLIVNSLTKYIGGHGNVLGGAVTNGHPYPWDALDNILDDYKGGPVEKWAITQIRKKGLRDFGATLDAEAANRIALGAETLALRVTQQCDNAQALCESLSNQSRCKAVYYPGLPGHPQAALTSELFKRPGSLFSFELDGIDAYEFMAQLKVVIKSSNLGDTRTLAIPVAQTIYHEMGPARRASMGIDESLIRISTGIEDLEDLQADFNDAFKHFA